MTVIENGADGASYRMRVTNDSRAAADAIIEPIAAERTRQGKLWGLGTGFLTIPAAIGAASPILWFKNNGTDQDWYIQSIIGGQTGSVSNPTHNVGVATLIKYGSAAPSANETQIFATIENIKNSVLDSTSGDTTGTRNTDFLGYKWDESGTAGMTTGSGGFYQIPNSWSLGHTKAEINGEIILGPGDSMQFDVMNTNLATSDTMEFHLSVVFYTVATNKERGTE